MKILGCTGMSSIAARKMSGCMAAVMVAVAMGVAGCSTGWFGSSARSAGASLSAEYLPKQPIIGQPITVMGFYLDSDLQGSASIPLSTTSVRIQLAPIKDQLAFRIDLGVAPLIDGHFAWTDTLRANYGGASLQASGSYFLIANFGYQVAPDGKSLGKMEYFMPFSPVASP